jgi:PleD family two-component response regulator
MQILEPKKVLAAVGDLFFSVKINDAAKRAGMAVEYAKDEKDVIAKAKTGPALIIFDLNFEDVRPLKVIPKLKSNADTRQISVIGFVSHVQGELKQKAQEAGCDAVLARSAFSQSLPQILKRHA